MKQSPTCTWCSCPVRNGAEMHVDCRRAAVRRALGWTPPPTPDRLTGRPAAESARWDRAEYQAERAIEREHEADPDWAWGESPNGIGGSQW